MNKVNKKGFTIVELVIVLAVIGILAGILIPTFANVIRKSQISADVQLAKNLNTVLATAAAEGRIPTSMYDVLYLENEAGYIIENLNPTNQDYYFAWDSANNKIVYLMDDLVTVYYPEEYKLDTTACWITVGTAEEAQKVADKGYNLALEGNINEPIVLNNVVSIDTLGFTCGDITMTENSTNTNTSNATVYLTGNFGNISTNVTNTSVVQSGTATSVTVTGNTNLASGSASSVTVTGSVSSLSVSGVNSATVSSTGIVSNVTKVETSAGSVINTSTGTVEISAQNSTVDGSLQADGSSVVTLTTKESIESVRTQIEGKRTFAGSKVVLANDINMSGIAFKPLSNNNRKGDANDLQSWFAGEFDGQGYGIIGFSNNGFKISGLNAGTNDTSVRFGNSLSGIVYDEAVYGLFGTVYNAKIKNLSVQCDIDMEIDSTNKYVGDSVGGIIGFAYGEYLEMENCVVTGSVKGYDGVGGLVGRAYAKNITLKNCKNYANITGARHTGGLVGFISNVKKDTCWFEIADQTVKFENCENYGVVANLGVQHDNDLNAYEYNSSSKTWDAVNTENRTNGFGYYIAASAYTGGTGTYNESIPGFTNYGSVYINGAEARGAGGGYYARLNKIS